MYVAANKKMHGDTQLDYKHIHMGYIVLCRLSSMLYLYASKTASYADNIAVMPPYVHMVSPQPGFGGLVGLSVKSHIVVQ